MLRHNRGNRRDTTEAKMKRKIRIIHETWGMNQKDLDEWLVEGVYRKGNVHCSCPMCAQKTNAKISKSRGAVYEQPKDPVTGHSLTGCRGNRLPTTNGRYGKKNYIASDRRKVDRMVSEEREIEAV